MLRPIALLAATLWSIAPAMAQDRWPIPEEVGFVIRMRDFGNALAMLESEVETCEAAGGEPDRCLDVIMMAANVASAARQTDTALAMASKAATIANANLPLEDIARARSNYMLGNILARMQRFDAAIPYYEQSVASFDTMPDTSNDQSRARGELIALYNMQGRYPDAERVRRTILSVYLAEEGPEATNSATAMINLALNLSTQQREARAEPLYRRALEIYRLKLPPEHPFIALAMVNLGVSMAAQDKFSEAEPLLVDALALREANSPPDSVDIAIALSALAMTRQSQGKLAEAEPMFRRALAIRRAGLAEGDPVIANGMLTLADNLRRQERYDEALPLYREARALWVATKSADNPLRINGDWSLAGILLEQGKNLAEARTLYRVAGDMAKRRVDSYTDFGPDAQRELSRWRNIYTGQTKVAWKLAQGAR